MQYKIIVDKQSRTNPSADKREYTIDIEELRCKGDVYDSLVITKDEDYVMRRLELTQYFVLKELEEPIKQPLNNINIELFEGDNYIYLIDMEGNKFYAEYLIKNDFNDVYATKNEMHNAIELSAQGIELNVNQKLTNYSTTKEMNALIELLSQSILLEVAKKVDNEDYTSAQILLKINNDTSEAKIKADKISLEGKTLNLADNMAIVSNHFNVNTNGKTKILAQQSNDDTFTVEDRDNENNKMYLQPGGTGFVGTSGRVDIQAQREGFDMSYVEVSDTNGKTVVEGGRIETPILTQGSQESQKKNFEKLEKAIDIIKNVDIYKYNLKNEEDGTKKHLGFVIGQDFKYSEELTNKDNTGVDIYSLASCCLEAIKEQQIQIENLEERI